MKNIAVILAAGNGKRFGEETPKQFYKINDKTLLEHSIEAFENTGIIDKIIVVCNEQFLHLVEPIVKNKNISIVYGGAERFESSYNAILFLKDIVGENDNILLHDSARAFTPKHVILNCISALKTFNAVSVAVQVKDTIGKIDSFGNIEENLNRNLLRAFQTPQGFKFSTIFTAFKTASESNMIFTDDCSVVKHFIPSVKIGVVEGSDLNIKITTKLDVELIKLLLLNSPL